MKKLKVLVVGSGGREHALAWKLAQSPRLGSLVVAPGNDLWPREWERWGDWDTREMREKALRARDAGVDLAVIGPDNPLAEGIVDAFAAEGIPCFGPTAAAAKLESSKAFAKEVMAAAGVPTARAFVADSLIQALGAINALNEVDGAPGESQKRTSGCVVKADGLALGKGVRVCSSPAEAAQACEELIRVSGRLVIEERLEGEELSWMAFCDGERCALLEPARDHKRLGDGDEGPNTGGMGAFSPVPGIPDSWAGRMRDEVFLPVLREMKKRGTPFSGLLYAGLMIDVKNDRFWVLEFNARFGDPETQVLLPRISDDLLDWCEGCARGSLPGPDGRDVRFGAEAAVVVVGAAPGYPDNPRKGIPLPERARSAVAPEIFWAGVKQSIDGRGRCELLTSGGRVFGAVGLGSSLAKAREKAYRKVLEMEFPGMQYRKDIGNSA